MVIAFSPSGLVALGHQLFADLLYLAFLMEEYRQSHGYFDVLLLKGVWSTTPVEREPEAVR
jgi:hypothetical protein